MQFTLNQRETELMIQDVENAIVSLRGKNGITSTYEIAAILMNILRSVGYSKLAYTYYQNRSR